MPRFRINDFEVSIDSNGVPPTYVLRGQARDVTDDGFVRRVVP
jgi:hypothetical protein